MAAAAAAVAAVAAAAAAVAAVAAAAAAAAAASEAAAELAALEEQAMVAPFAFLVSAADFEFSTTEFLDLTPFLRAAQET